MFRVAVTIALMCLTGCALDRDFVEIQRQPPQAVSIVAGAGAVDLGIEARDARATNRDRISVKKNGYGMEMAPIVATNDVVAELRQAIADDLSARGYRIGGGSGGRIEIEVLKFFSDFKIGFWAGAAIAEISANVRVLDTNGRITFAKVYTVEGAKPDILLANGSNAKLALERGMASLVHAVGSDPDLQRALLGLAPQPDQSLRPRGQRSRVGA